MLLVAEGRLRHYRIETNESADQDEDPHVLDGAALVRQALQESSPQFDWRAAESLDIPLPAQLCHFKLTRRTEPDVCGHDLAMPALYIDALRSDSLDVLL